VVDVLLEIFYAHLRWLASGRFDGLCKGRADGRVGNAVFPSFQMAGNLAPKAWIRVGRQSEVIPAKKLMSIAKVTEQTVWL
jgi:hypothetical protein